MRVIRSQRPSVLVVEDDPEITELLHDILSESYEVSCVGDVPTAIAHLDRSPAPDVILLDFLLPGGRCMKVLEKAKTAGCSVVFMLGSLEAVAELAAFGYPYLQKPFRIQQLFDALASALASPGYSAQPAQLGPVQGVSAETCD